MSSLNNLDVLHSPCYCHVTTLAIHIFPVVSWDGKVSIGCALCNLYEGHPLLFCLLFHEYCEFGQSLQLFHILFFICYIVGKYTYSDAANEFQTLCHFVALVMSIGTLKMLLLVRLH